MLAALVIAGCTPWPIVAPSPTASHDTVATPAHTRPAASAAPEATGCAVTLPGTSWVAPLADYNPLPGIRFQWYGDTSALAVDLPVDGVYRVPVGNTTLGAKIPWWRYATGNVQIVARKVDGAAPDVSASAGEGYGASAFAPSGIEFTSEGCWHVTGTLGAQSLAFTMYVRRAVSGEPSP